MNLALDRNKIISAVVIVVLLAGVSVGVYLVQRTQIFKPRASATDIIFRTANGSPLPIVNQNGQDLPQTDSLTVEVEFNPPSQ